PPRRGPLPRDLAQVRGQACRRDARPAGAAPAAGRAWPRAAGRRRARRPGRAEGVKRARHAGLRRAAERRVRRRDARRARDDLWAGAARRAMRMMLALFPDLKFELLDVITAGDETLVSWVATATL